jgi:hypothetical protein
VEHGLTFGEDCESVANLEGAFHQEIFANKRIAAETAYALACRYRTEYVECDQLPFDVARKWALRSIELLEALPSDNVGQVASTRLYVGGVDLPELLHADVVRERLADLLRAGRQPPGRVLNHAFRAAVMLTGNLVLDERFPIAANAAATKLRVEALQVSGAELVQRKITERWLDNAINVTAVAVTRAVFQVSLRRPLLDGVTELYGGRRVALFEHLGEELRSLVPGLLPGRIVVGPDGLSLVGSATCDWVQTGVHHHAEVASALLDPALVTALWARTSHSVSVYSHPETHPMIKFYMLLQLYLLLIVSGAGGARTHGQWIMSPLL